MESTEIKFYWTDIDPEQRPLTSWLNEEIDGIAYNYLSAQYDPNDDGNNICGSSDTLRKISSAEAEVCYNLLKDTCEIVAERSCPCFSLGSLSVAEDSIRAGDTILDQEKSCVEPAGDHDQYGLFQIDEDNQSQIAFTVNGIGDMCLMDSDIAVSVNTDQGFHCKKMMTYACAALDLPKGDGGQAKCHDDPDFLFNGNRRKDCAWVGGDKKKCRKMNRGTGKRVFEFCRASCGYCACEDDENFHVNGQADKDCAWVADNAEDRCAMAGVSEHCIQACSHRTKCCEDNADFKWWGNHKHDCEWVAGNGKSSKSNKRREARCGKKAIAANCADTCGKCPV